MNIVYRVPNFMQKRLTAVNTLSFSATNIKMLGYIKKFEIVQVNNTIYSYIQRK
jgi:hypothetical protein